MSIRFEKIRWANFLSTGDNFTQIDLSAARSTLIVGENGSGKSTLIDALSFALFGKPHRSIKKAQLVNSVNGKGALVEVSFTVSGTHFTVVRGIKPNKFEIYRDGQMIDQSANSRDYQKFLEGTILKLNHKSFHQIVVLGSSSFIPFMQLPAQGRREIIEDLLDIQVFSRMREILKDQLSALREEIRDADHSIDLTREKIQLQERHIEEIRQINDSTIRGYRDNCSGWEKEIEELKAQNTELEEYIAANSVDDQIADLVKKRDQIKGYEGQFKQQIQTLVKEAKFYEENDTCPTCTQAISQELRKEKLSVSQKKAHELQQGIHDATEQSTDLDASIERLRSTAKQTGEARASVRANNDTIARLERQIRDTQAEIASLQSKEGDLGSAEAELASLNEQRVHFAERRANLLEEQTYKRASGEMLKDTGIKTKVVREYLPLMNSLINQYLQSLDFFVSFHLDEEFNESIKSRYRDDFNYTSFSEGEKAKIDLALMFTWRQIARAKNTTSTNLLILDEVFDGSLDSEGVDNLLSILNTLDDDTNTFVISHKGDQVLDNKFARKLSFGKDGNFSVMRVEEE